MYKEVVKQKVPHTKTPPAAASSGVLNFLTFVEVPKRSTVLYVRITDENKDFVEAAAEKMGISTSIFIDNLLSELKNSTTIKLPPRKKKHAGQKNNFAKRNQQA